MCAFPDWRGDEFLVTAETVFGAAIGYDWFFRTLSDIDRQAVARAILTKGVRPGLNEFAADPPARWTTQPTNWNLVCNGALMIAALSVAEVDWSMAGQIFDLCRLSISTGFEAYQPDGGWAEGPGYWHYGTQYAVYLVDSLTTALGDDLGLGGSKGFGNTGLFRLHAASPSGRLFNFGDSEDKHSGGYWLFWFAKRYHHPVDAWIERQNGKAHPGKVHPMDLLWFDPDARRASSDHLRPGHAFLGIDVAMLRGDWNNPRATYLASRAEPTMPAATRIMISGASCSMPMACAGRSISARTTTICVTISIRRRAHGTIGPVRSDTIPSLSTDRASRLRVGLSSSIKSSSPLYPGSSLI